MVRVKKKDVQATQTGQFRESKITVLMFAILLPGLLLSLIIAILIYFLYFCYRNKRVPRTHLSGIITTKFRLNHELEVIPDLNQVILFYLLCL